jgi:uncharacterized protein YukE
VREPDQNDSDSAYSWVSASPSPLKPLPQLPSSSSGGLDGGIDSVVHGVLESTGLLDQLDKVTGQPQALMAAAQTWQSQAVALRGVADQLRGGAGPVARAWHGSASSAFGTFMGQVVAGIDATAEDADNTAGILASAAAECQWAEDTVIAIIREAIEWIGLTIAAGFLADLFTLGLASIVDALATEAEMAAFIERVSVVSEKLATSLEKLMEELKEMKEAEKLGEGISAANKARKTIKDIRTGGRQLSKLGTYGNAYKSLGAIALKPIDSEIAKPILKGLTGASGDPMDPAKKLLAAAEGKQPGEQPPPPAYHVNKSRIEQAFG